MSRPWGPPAAIAAGVIVVLFGLMIWFAYHSVRGDVHSLDRAGRSGGVYNWFRGDASSDARATPACASNSSAQGNASSACRRGATSKRSCTCPSAYSATEQASVAVSKASSFIWRGGPLGRASFRFRAVRRGAAAE